MKKIVLLFFLALFTLTAWSKETYTVSGGVGNTPYRYSDDMGVGVEAVYIINSLADATISYRAESSSSKVQFYRYEKSLANWRKVNSSTLDDINYTVTDDLEDGWGYYVEEGNRVQATIWIIDYSKHRPQLSSINALSDGDPREGLKLLIEKSDELYYHANNGGRRNIKREYTIEFNTLKWDESSKKFVPNPVKEKSSDIGTEYLLKGGAPMINTTFKMSGDQFGEHFKIPVSITSPEYTASLVKGYIISEPESRNNANERETEVVEENGELVGSGPIDIKFYGYANEPTAHYYTWFIYNTRDMKNALARYTDKKIRYEFAQAGTFAIMLEVADQNSICVDTAMVKVRVRESDLDIPNYFSPGDTPGMNDEFRVAYRSLVSFKCTIFNRWGTKIFQWTDPAKGWDGRYKGKYVAPGVYFYVIEALGSDGERYKRGGDINILRSK